MSSTSSPHRPSDLQIIRSTSSSCVEASDFSSWTMSSAQNKTSNKQASRSASRPESSLEALQCHFTWNLDSRRSKLLHLRDHVEDIGTEVGNSWLGSISNLQGYIHYQLGLTEDALRFFSEAAEGFRQTRHTDSEEGPWLMVNYGNLAWLHHHLGDQEESQAYLLKVEAMLKRYPSPSKDELHPEICAEKGWTLMKFGKECKLLAVEYFQKAIEMQPDMVEWNSSHVLALANTSKFEEPLKADILEKMRVASENDPENFYVAACYLHQRARRGENIKDEAQELAQKVLRSPVSSYSGLKPLLRCYYCSGSVDEAIDLAEEALQQHPEERYLKRCAAVCYNWRIVFRNGPPVARKVFDRAIHVHKEAITLYPESSRLTKFHLASILAKSGDQTRADHIYQQLLEEDMEPLEQQMMYNYYAKYLYFEKRDHQKSNKYYMKAASIPIESYFQKNSIRGLEQVVKRGRHRMCPEIKAFLNNLQRE